MIVDDDVPNSTGALPRDGVLPSGRLGCRVNAFFSASCLSAALSRFTPGSDGGRRGGCGGVASRGFLHMYQIAGRFPSLGPQVGDIICRVHEAVWS